MIFYEWYKTIVTAYLDLFSIFCIFSASKNRLQILQLGTPGRSIFLCRELARTHQRPYIFHHFCGTTSRARGNRQPKARPQLHHKVGSLSMAKRCESVGVSPWAHEPVSPWARETQTKQDLHALCPRCAQLCLCESLSGRNAYPNRVPLELARVETVQGHSMPRRFAVTRWHDWLVESRWGVKL